MARRGSVRQVSQAPQGYDSEHGLVAQWIERLRPKEGVGGSSPSEAATILNLK